MQPNWKRVAVMVGAVVVVGTVVERDAVAAFVHDDAIASEQLTPSQIRINLDKIGVSTVLYSLERAADGDIPQRCAFQASTRQRVCSHHAPTARVSAATAFALRSGSGAAQSDFDPATTDTVIVRTALLNDDESRTAERSADFSYHATRRYAGVRAASAMRVLDGADSSFRTFTYRNGRVVRNSTFITYSNVAFSKAAEGARQYPTSGIVRALSESRATADSAKTMHGLNVVVYFDGTRTPEAYIGGARYTLDLASGIATPKALD